MLDQKEDMIDIYHIGLVFIWVGGFCFVFLNECSDSRLPLGPIFPLAISSSSSLGV